MLFSEGSIPAFRSNVGCRRRRRRRHFFIPYFWLSTATFACFYLVFFPSPFTFFLCRYHLSPYYHRQLTQSLFAPSRQENHHKCISISIFFVAKFRARFSASHTHTRTLRIHSVRYWANTIKSSTMAKSMKPLHTSANTRKCQCIHTDLRGSVCVCAWLGKANLTA